jgi:4-hydroxybenzoate polyprenyltransferase
VGARPARTALFAAARRCLMTGPMGDAAPASASDIPAGGWIDRRVPAGLRPYCRLARLDRPIGTWLLLLPCWWSLALAANYQARPGHPDLGLLALFAIGAVAMRGAGCTFNDIVDRDIDAKVARTAGRPLPSGAVTLAAAVAFLTLQALIGLAVLVQLNRFAIAVGAASLLVVAVYPFMKRITYWPQAVLGLAFNWGALLGWAAVTGSLALPAVVLYAAGVAWTLAYDTIYAHQDKDDDLLVGVKSTALRFGAATPVWLAAFFAVAIVLIGVAGWLAGLAWPFYAALALAAGHAAWQTRSLDIDDPQDCLVKFRSNRDFGLIVFAGIVLGGLV